MNSSPSERTHRSPQRQIRSILEPLETPALRWLAARVPGWTTPDMLTGLGFAGSVLCALGYALSARDSRMLWLASVGLVVNWFGDSVDGTLARVRGIERPLYGFFIDNATDVLEYAVFAVGFGLSGYVRWELVLGTLAAFYMMMLLELIIAQVTNVLPMAFNGIGLTEVRCGFICVNALIYFVPPQQIAVGGISTSYPDILSALWIAGQLATFLTVSVKTLRDLAKRDPPKR
jgi:archaetidylinositol phosphate synthase